MRHFCAQAPSQARMPAPSTALLSAHSLLPTVPPGACGIRPTVPQALAASEPPHPSAYSLGPSAPGARSIRPTVPQVPAASGPSHPSTYSPRPSTRGFHPTVRQTLPAYRTTRRLAPWHGPLLHIMPQAPARQLSAMSAIRMPNAHGPPRLYTPGARDFPLMGTSVAHDPSRICTLDVHGFSCAAQCAPSAPHIPRKFVLLRFGAGRVPVKPAGHHDARPAGPRSGLFSRWPIPHPPRPLPHRSRR